MNNFALKLYFIQLSTTHQWLAVENYSNFQRSFWYSGILQTPTI